MPRYFESKLEILRLKGSSLASSCYALIIILIKLSLALIGMHQLISKPALRFLNG